MEKILKLSVHQLVDFLLRKGDIDNRIYNRSSMSEGTILHASYQRRQQSDYIAEYLLTHTFMIDDFQITLQGRADGVINRPFLTIIDEIKTSVIDNEKFYESQKEWHLGQAKVYALIYALDHHLEKMGVRLTYINQLDNKQLLKEFVFTTNELNIYVDGLLRKYLEFYQLIFHLKELRNASSKVLEFPFPKYRKGQKELAKYTYASLTKGTYLYVEAPTGIGKTMSTLYPAVKTFSDGTVDKIFYLTAKNSGIESAFSATEILKQHGLEAQTIQITAREKICPCFGKSCNPNECTLAKGYYEKVNIAIVDAINRKVSFSKNEVINIAFKHEICPFEFQLDLSLFCDIIVCDFNYLFDPIVYMRRYFDTFSDDYVALIDEAHNLVERGREMYSTSLSFDNFKKMKKSVSKNDHKKLKTSIRKINKIFKEYEENCSENFTLQNSINSSLISALSNFQKAASDFMKKDVNEVKDCFKDFFFETIRFIKISEFFDDSFRFLITKNNTHLSLTLLNLDCSKLLKNSLCLLKGAVLFSGTLSPVDYYVQLLGGNEDSPILKIPSPFPPKNLKLMIAPNISTKYNKRKETYGEVAKYIITSVSQKVGNYFIFFPSYNYLHAVLKYFQNSDFILHIQSPAMSEEEKEKFLNNFQSNPTTTHLGFAVLGGSFAEGIDLLSDRLIGAVIVGVGMPQISYERDLIKDYFNSKGKNGFEYAYVKPGMNRVMQAVGRVIRSENDRGMVLLIDDRYLTRQYREMFKSEWKHYSVVLSLNDIKKELTQFYQEFNK